MVYVPGGTFQMGSDADDVDDAMQLCNDYYHPRSSFEDEQPAHQVRLGAFWVDRTEVSNDQYALCVAAGRCEESAYADDPSYNGGNHPVVGVDWYNARAFCQWVGARLPTEAEWEYAARGAEGRIFPWGHTFDGTRLNHCDTNCSEIFHTVDDDGFERSAPVGSYLKGASWCDAMDMAGNVFEYVADWYGDYASGEQANPTGPSSGESKVVRGGSWGDSLCCMRGAHRYWCGIDQYAVWIGFRCAMNAH